MYHLNAANANNEPDFTISEPAFSTNKIMFTIRPNAVKKVQLAQRGSLISEFGSLLASVRRSESNESIEIGILSDRHDDRLILGNDYRMLVLGCKAAVRQA